MFEFLTSLAGKKLKGIYEEVNAMAMERCPDEASQIALESLRDALAKGIEIQEAARTKQALKKANHAKELSEYNAAKAAFERKVEKARQLEEDPAFKDRLPAIEQELEKDLQKVNKEKSEADTAKIELDAADLELNAANKTVDSLTEKWQTFKATLEMSKARLNDAKVRAKIAEDQRAMADQLAGLNSDTSSTHDKIVAALNKRTSALETQIRTDQRLTDIVGGGNAPGSTKPSSIFDDPAIKAALGEDKPEETGSRFDKFKV